MSRAFGCPVCGDDDCGRHRGVLAVATGLHVCVLTGLGLLIVTLVWSAMAIVQ
jgi:hypothetical protein